MVVKCTSGEAGRQAPVLRTPTALLPDTGCVVPTVFRMCLPFKINYFILCYPLYTNVHFVTGMVVLDALDPSGVGCLVLLQTNPVGSRLSNQFALLYPESMVLFLLRWHEA